MKKYEAIFILDMRKVEDDGKAFAEEFGKMIQNWGGVVNETNLMGRKQFAREIKKRKTGIYWDYVFELDSLKCKEVRNMYRLDERVIRILIVNYERPEGVPAIAGATLAE